MRALGLAAIAGCADDPVTAPGPSFTADVAPIVDSDCVACHGGDLPSGGLDLSGDAYTAIVGVPSTQVEGLALVEPGDSLYSYLWHKVNGSQAIAGGVGTSMPLGGALDADSIERIAAWIDSGAAE